MPGRISPFRFAAGDGLQKLLKRNKAWAQDTDVKNPGLFASNAKGQQPPILWIGCADSRATDSCLDLLPGEVFVHRNVANMIPHQDPSSQSLLQLAMEVVGCNMILVCGHTNCKGVNTVLHTQKVGGFLEGWLRGLREIRAKHKDELDAIEDPICREDRLVELNVIEQVWNVRENDIVREHMKSRGVEVFGVVYDVATGLLKEIEIPTDPKADSFYLE